MASIIIYTDMFICLSGGCLFCLFVYLFVGVFVCLFVYLLVCFLFFTTLDVNKQVYRVFLRGKVDFLEILQSSYDSFVLNRLITFHMTRYCVW